MAQPYSDSGVIKTPSPLIHSLQNTFFSSNNRAKHVSVWTTSQTLSERPADVKLLLKVRLQNTNFSLDLHTAKPREPCCAQKHCFTEEPVSQSFFCNLTAGSQVSQQSHQESPPLQMSHLQSNRSLSISLAIAPTSNKNVTKAQQEMLWPLLIHGYTDKYTTGERLSLPKAA